MATLNFEDTRLVIADSGGQIRDEIRSILRHEGFRDIMLVDSVPKVEDLVTEDKIDLLITDHKLPGGDINKLIRQIRHHEKGNNPFIVIIALAENPEKDEIMRIINSGSDDIMLKPITAGMLVKRVHLMVNQRKDFVVTSEYIGPTRRSGNREGTIEIPEFEVPNPVKIKALGQPSGASFQKEIDDIAKVINEQKVERNAFQISYLVEKLMPHYVEGNATTDTSEQLDQLKFVSEDIGRRLKGSKYDHVSELCSTLLGVVKNVCKNPQKAELKDLQLLPQLAQAIDTAFTSNTADETIARTIADSVQQRKL